MSVLRDHLFLVDPPTSTPTGWSVAVTGSERRAWSAFASAQAADAHLNALFARWRRAAHAKGGFLWRQTAWRWVATLPESAPCAGLPFTHTACTHHDTA